MTAKEYSALCAWFEGYAAAFRENGVLHPMLELKRLHSLRVAENAGLIASKLGQGPGEIELARAAGLLHDAGRFTQFARYGSFSDTDTVDHGARGRRVLEEEESLPFHDAGERRRLFCAVQYHNRRTEDIPVLEAGEAELLRICPP
jgi:hypothetical protein